MQDSAIEVAKSYNEIFDVTENFQEATCNGKEATCPASLPMADGTKCIDRGECRGGKCIPFCETQDLQVRSTTTYIYSGVPITIQVLLYTNKDVSEFD